MQRPTRPHQRPQHLALIRQTKMARSAHAFVRGSTLQFYEWLHKAGPGLPAGPPIWICGDCHLGNLGPLANAKGRVSVQIRDLDQTVIGNPAHDIVRLGLSLASAARSADLSGVTTARMMESLVAGYQLSLDGDFDNDKAHRPKEIEQLLAAAVRRNWRHLAEERLEDVKPAIPLGRRFWPVTSEEKAAVKQIFADEAAQRIITSLNGRDDDAPVTVLDVAYWVKGCSSLGRLRYAVLLGVGAGKHSGYCLADIKEGIKPAAPADAKISMPRDNAVRVVAGAKALSPNLGNRMFAARLLGKSVVVRELMPQDLKLEVNRLDPDDALKLAAYLGRVVGRAHGRQLAPGARRAWRAELRRRRTKDLDAPSWLWSSVTDLIGVHEAAYLEHCRRLSARAA